MKSYPGLDWVNNMRTIYLRNRSKIIDIFWTPIRVGAMVIEKTKKKIK